MTCIDDQKVTALVAGATGNIGGEVVRALVDRGATVRGLVRRAEAVLPDGVEPVVGNLDEPASLRGGLRGVDAVFLLPGYRDMPGLLSELRDADVKRVVLLSGSSAGDGDLTNAISAYMIRSERSVHESGLPWTVLRPSMFMTNTLQWAKQLRAGDVVRAPFPDAAAAVIAPADIAEVVAIALLGDHCHGHTYRLTGPQALLPAERVRILGTVLGRELRFEAQSNSEARREMSASMPPEYVEAFMRFYADGELDESPVLGTVEQVTGHPPRSFEEWATANADAFRR